MNKTKAGQGNFGFSVEPLFAALCHSLIDLFSISEKRTTAGGRIADLPARHIKTN